MSPEVPKISWLPSWPWTPMPISSLLCLSWVPICCQVLFGSQLASMNFGASPPSTFVFQQHCSCAVSQEWPQLSSIMNIAYIVLFNSPSHLRQDFMLLLFLWIGNQGSELVQSQAISGWRYNSPPKALLLPLRSSTLSQAWVVVFMNAKLVESPACKLLNQHDTDSAPGMLYHWYDISQEMFQRMLWDHITGVDNKRLTGCILPWSPDPDPWLNQSIGPQ